MRHAGRVTEVLLLADDDQQLVTWRAADDESAARMAETLGEDRRVSPAQLSIVVNADRRRR